MAGKAIFGRPQELQYPAAFVLREVVVGCSLNSLLFAYLNRIPIILTESLPPAWFYKLEEDLPGHIAHGCATYHDVWCKLIMELSLAGKVLFPGMLKKVSVSEDERELLVFLKGKKLIFKPEKIHIGDAFNISGLPEPCEIENSDLHLVYDWFDGEVWRNHFPEEIFDLSDGKTPFRLMFVDSIKDKVNRGVQVCIALSHMTTEELHSPDFSIQQMRNVVRTIMHENNLSTSPHRAWLKIKSVKRDSVPLRREIRQSTEFLNYIPETLQGVIDASPSFILRGDYDEDLRRYLHRKKDGE